ncbi:hypothetical protein HKCCE2091_20000 [Rhodobacterales bacterium HKCCE2091]|nr:hypothetical protein [Rhodobacterales bacterium HKCCE2091]
MTPGEIVGWILAAIIGFLIFRAAARAFWPESLFVLWLDFGGFFDRFDDFWSDFGDGGDGGCGGGFDGGDGGGGD